MSKRVFSLPNLMIRKIKFTLAKHLLSLKPSRFNAMLAVKGSKPLLNHLLNVVRVVVGGMSVNWVRLTVILVRRLHSILRAQGLNGYVKYLKVCSVLVQQVIGGHVERDITPLGPRVKRSKGGLPRILPVLIRRRIREGDPISIRWALTIFALYRVIFYSAPIKTAPITDPRSVGLQGEKSLYKYISLYLGLFIRGDVVPKELDSPDPFPIYSSSPNSDAERGELSSHPTSVVKSRIALWNNPRTLEILLDFVTQPTFAYSERFHIVFEAATSWLKQRLGHDLVKEAQELL
jgi:hypothetical protein